MILFGEGQMIGHEMLLINQRVQVTCALK